MGASTEETLVREVREEVSLDLTPVWLEFRASNGVARARPVLRGSIYRLGADEHVDPGNAGSENASTMDPKIGRHVDVSLFGVYSNPRRDARRHTASVVYVVELAHWSPLYRFVPKAGDDTAHCSWVDVSTPTAEFQDKLANSMAFDHGLIVREFLASFQSAFVRPKQASAIIP